MQKIINIISMFTLLCAIMACSEQSPKNKRNTPKEDKINKTKESNREPEYRVNKFICKIPYEGESFEENSYVFYDNVSKDGVIIDPGFLNKEMEGFISSNKIKIKAILNTHGHSDHVLANGDYKTKYGVPVIGPLQDKHLYAEQSESNKPTRFIDKEKTMSFGKITLQILYTPGHTKGSLCFYAGNHLLCGDTIFKGSIGRTWEDENHSEDENQEILISNIRKYILPLPKTTKIHPGHGDETTIENEIQNNEWLQQETD